MQRLYFICTRNLPFGMETFPLFNSSTCSGWRFKKIKDIFLRFFVLFFFSSNFSKYTTVSVFSSSKEWYSSHIHIGLIMLSVFAISLEDHGSNAGCIKPKTIIYTLVFVVFPLSTQE